MKRWQAALAALFLTAATPANDANKDWLSRTAMPVSFGEFRVPQQIAEGRVILLGEVHGIAHGQSTDLAMLMALHRQAGVRHYIGEFDPSQADAFNRLLDTGETAPMDAVFAGWRKRGLQWANADFRAKLIAIAKWNRRLPSSQRIRFIGVDEVQDPIVFCSWLAARMAGDSAALANRLQAAASDPKNCGAGLREAAKSVELLDPVARDALAALAVDASQADREARIAANIGRHLQAIRTPLYGLWGIGHVAKAPVNKSEPMALLLARQGVAVRSMAILNLAGRMMIPVQAADGKIEWREMPYTVDSEQAALVNGIEPFTEAARWRITIFPLAGSNSPFRGSDALTRVGGAMGRMQPFTIDPTGAVDGFWADAVIVSRGSPATRALPG